MSDGMTLDWVSRRLRERKTTADDLLADAIDAHLSQPAQAVDVGAIEQVAEEMGKDGGRLHDDWMHRLTRALSGEKAGRVDELDVIARRLYAKWTDNQGIHSNRFPGWLELGDAEREKWRAKAASPTPGKEKK